MFEHTAHNKTQGRYNMTRPNDVIDIYIILIT